MSDPLESPYDFCGHLVPGYWQFLLPDPILKFRLPKERQATCQDCPMSRFHGHDAMYRCCAYHPQVPNYLLGLAAGQPQARAAIEAMDRSGFLIPEGFTRSHGQWLDYLTDLQEDKFDGNARVRCPLLEVPSGLCQIYAFRNSICSTFFCINDHGAAGDRFWESLEEMVSYAELALSQWALMRVGFDVGAFYDRLDSLAPRIKEVSDPQTGGWKPEILEFLWGDFHSRRVETYIACGHEISAHRDRLWEIARNQPVMDAKKFEQAGVDAVPDHLRDQIDPADLDESEEIMTLDELYDEVMDQHRRLWRLPKQLKLSPRSKLVPNPKDDAESRAFDDRPFMAAYLKKTGGKNFEWRQFISPSEHDALKYFDGVKTVGPDLFHQLNQLGVADPAAFLAEWSGKKFLLSEGTAPNPRIHSN